MTKIAQKRTRYLGLDVHAESISIAVAEPDASVRSLGKIPNEEAYVAKLIKKLQAQDKQAQLCACYEAGPCGYALYWQLEKLGVVCTVIAPTLVPVKVGDRVKTDKKDAEKLARCFRAGDLTAVWVPDPAHEALRDLVRARESALKDCLRAKHRLGKFLLKQGIRSPYKAWTCAHMTWLEGRRFAHYAQQAVHGDYLAQVKHHKARIEHLEKAIDVAMEQMPPSMQQVVSALQTLRGVAKMTAVTVVSEVGQLSRFESAKKMMAYAGLVPTEHSSGASIRKGALTKTGNAHLRRVLGEAAFHYRFKPALAGALKKRQQGQPEDIKAIAWKAQHRLHNKYIRMTFKGKPKGQVLSAVSRELVGFLWDIGQRLEQRAA